MTGFVASRDGASTGPSYGKNARSKEYPFYETKMMRFPVELTNSSFKK